ncbi:MAG: ABC transporter ATP-binding protein [Deltaproteobacteria bacterium]|nr:ABC transporter ATP-binding protein [Deltaproteobacteria bacterium]
MIQYRRVNKIFGDGHDVITAVKDVTFDIKKGHLVAFLGPSGCGKTTLLRLTNRLVSLTSGNITIKEQDIMDWDEVKLRQSMGYAIQEIGLFPNKTIYGNIAIVPRLLGWDEKKTRQRADDLLMMLQMDPGKFRDRYPTELSGGQQQRIGVARCLAADPDILLMDEPFGAIDPINREEIQNEFLKLQGDLKKTIAFVTHDIHEAIKMGDKIAIFRDGQLIQYDVPEAILTCPANKYITDFVGSDRILKVLGILSAGEAMEKEPANIIRVSASSREAYNFLSDNRFESLIVHNQSKPVGYLLPESLIEGDAKLKDLVEPFSGIINKEDSLRNVLSYLLINGVGYLPVVDHNGNLSGTVSYSDIQKIILDVYAQSDR